MLRVVSVRILHRPGCRWYTISTLNPSRLLPSDCIPFKSINSAKLADVYDPSNSNSSLFLSPKHIQYIPDPSPYGFLYLHRPEGAPSTVSELRFRVVERPSESIASKLPHELFLNGTDLVLRNNVAYSLPLYKIVKKTSLWPLKEFLVKDGVVSEELVERVDNIFPNMFPDSTSSPISPATVVYKLNQPFPIHVFHNKATIFLVSEDQVLDLNLGSSWLGYPQKRRQICRGSALVVIDHESSPSPSDEFIPSISSSISPLSEDFSSSPSSSSTSTSSTSGTKGGAVLTPYLSPAAVLHLQKDPNRPRRYLHPNTLHPYILRVVKPPRAAPRTWFENKWRRIKESHKRHKEIKAQEDEGSLASASTSTSTPTPSSAPLSIPFAPSASEPSLLSKSQLTSTIPSSSSLESDEEGTTKEGNQLETKEKEEREREQEQEQDNAKKDPGPKFYTPYIQAGRSTRLRAFSYMVDDQAQLGEIVKRILR
ncbi:hypothetical protein D9758_007911 [Tetrapyrgos nigripes]|uniref:Uncharacterized protein n=1 Tax=Tetrapyrgos nigripes TaxID=182062 RepID=A0A8H5D3E6_9AGAR|nr:hypothetical protein D9758_007911 [Tetrapyrgos nigripes]